MRVFLFVCVCSGCFGFKGFILSALALWIFFDGLEKMEERIKDRM